MCVAGEPKKKELTTWTPGERPQKHPISKMDKVRISRSPRWRRNVEEFHLFTFDRCEQAQIVAWEKKGTKESESNTLLIDHEGSLEHQWSSMHQWVSKAPVPHGVLTEDACRMGVASAGFPAYQKMSKLRPTRTVTLPLPSKS
jgi:hypothetical protein